MRTREHIIALGSASLYGVTALAWAAHSGAGVWKMLTHAPRMLDLCVYGTVAYAVLVILLLFCIRWRRREMACTRSLKTLAVAGIAAAGSAQPFLLVYLWLALKHASLMIHS